MQNSIKFFILLMLFVSNILRLSFMLAGGDLNKVIFEGHFNDLIDVPSFSIGTIYLLIHFDLKIKFIHSILISIAVFLLACSWKMLSYLNLAFGPWQTADIIDVVCYGIGLFISVVYLYLDYSQQKNMAT